MTTSIVIPARLASTRLPNKVLLDLGGKPLVQRVWEAAKRVKNALEVVVLTESEIVQEVVEGFGGVCHLTPTSCANGTERICSALAHLAGNFVLNVQGDEPFVSVELLEHMIGQTRMQTHFDVLTPIHKLENFQQIFNPNVVKVVRRHDGSALYFSRSPIPHCRDLPEDQWPQRFTHYGHMGIYLYRKDFLEKMSEIPPSTLATAESLEQLRFLEAGYTIQTVMTTAKSMAIDVPADLEAARKICAEMTQPAAH